MVKTPWNLILKVLATLLGLGFIITIVVNLVAEFLWFQEVDYISTFLQRTITQLGLYFFTSSISVLFLLGNFKLADRFKWHFIPKVIKQSSPIMARGDTNSSVQALLPASRSLKLPILLLLFGGFALLIGLMLIYYGQLAYDLWKIDYTLPKVTPTLPSPFIPTSLTILSQNLWKWVVIILVLIIITFGEFWLKAIAVGLSVIFGLVISGNWTIFLEYFNKTSFHQSDPQFHQDISFYIFQFPFWQLLDFWIGGVFLYALVSVTLSYLLSANSFSEGKFPGFSQAQLHHIYLLGSGMMLVLTFHHWLNCYGLVYSHRGVIYGAGFTDLKVALPVYIILLFLSLAIAIWLFVQVISNYKKDVIIPKKIKFYPFLPLLFLFYLLIFLGGNLTSSAVQNIDVEPNELQKELPYIERTIDLTRKAFNLNNIEVRTFDPNGQLTTADLIKNDLTIQNIRLWDTTPLLETNRQLQQIRLYYQFLDADIDRYDMAIEKLGFNTTNIEKQQVFIAPRELDYNLVPPEAKTWVNEHLVYTHGYGFTISPVNQVDQGGLPYYFVKDIGTSTEAGALKTSSELISNTFPIGKPRLYYGELTNTYILTNTQVRELDFPSGSDNAYNTYDGTGGIGIGSIWRRLLFAVHLKDWRMLFTNYFNPETKLLLDRNINVRVRQIAPFLHYDSDPYLVVADADDAKQGQSENYLHWMIDAYTTSNYYPYSDPGDNKFNYIRNSVKIVIDAYHGDIDFYVSDPDDPIIQAWQNIFPDLFKPLAEMPASLRTHIRYPQDLFSVQSEKLLTYHMKDPKVFYNREDKWQIGKEIYDAQSKTVEPYYQIMRLPTATREEFILLHPYTPTSRKNLIALLYGRSDGKDYGKMILYELPKQRLIYGTEQIEARINQDPDISQQISLWNRDGSRAVQGNLLVIPIEDSVLYVEPLYLEATDNALPTLVRVIVVYKEKIAMKSSLKEAFAEIFSQ